jgi:hypothetical protein
MKILFLGLFLGPLVANAQLFYDASSNLPASASGANMDVRAADLDQDGDLDLVFAREGVPNFILRNNGSGVFTNATPGNLPQPFNDSEDVAIADFNKDGFLDLVFCSEDNFPAGQTNVHEYYWGDGKGKFSPAPYQFPDSEANAVITADLNIDGAPDVIFGNNGLLNVLINDGKGLFELQNNRIPAIYRTTQDLILFDADGDKDDDLMVGNENGNLLYFNDGNGFFTDSTHTRLPKGLELETRKIAVGDVDMDGDLDVFLANVMFRPGKNIQNRLFLNNGKGYFSDVTALQLPEDQDHTIDAIFEDVDLDTDLDIVLANVFGAPLKIYANDGKGFFTDSSAAFLGKDYFRDALGVIAADLNGDGLRDLYVCHRRMPGNTQKDLLLLRKSPLTLKSYGDLNAPLTIFPNPVQGHFYMQTGIGTSLDTVEIKPINGQSPQRIVLKSLGQGLFRADLPAHASVKGAVIATFFSKGSRVGEAKIVFAGP